MEIVFKIVHLELENSTCVSGLLSQYILYTTILTLTSQTYEEVGGRKWKVKNCPIGGASLEYDIKQAAGDVNSAPNRLARKVLCDSG